MEGLGDDLRPPVSRDPAPLSGTGLDHSHHSHPKQILQIVCQHAIDSEGPFGPGSDSAGIRRWGGSSQRGDVSPQDIDEQSGRVR